MRFALGQQRPRNAPQVAQPFLAIGSRQKRHLKHVVDGVPVQLHRIARLRPHFVEECILQRLETIGGGLLPLVDLIQAFGIDLVQELGKFMRSTGNGLDFGEQFADLVAREFVPQAGYPAGIIGQLGQDLIANAEGSPQPAGAVADLLVSLVGFLEFVGGDRPIVGPRTEEQIVAFRPHLIGLGDIVRDPGVNKLAGGVKRLA